LLTRVIFPVRDLNIGDASGVIRDELAALGSISNAIKFTPEGGAVSLNYDLDKDKGLIIIIFDTGVGMTKEEIKQALELFGQVDSSMERKYEGTGLGLPLAKRLVEAQGGTLNIESETN
jgi:signal transduction histidine kinase